MRHALKLLGALAFATGGTAAANDDAYAPSGATQWNDGYRSVVIATSRGTIELASFGIVELTPREAPALHTMHVRMVVSNLDDPAPWSLDAATARLAIDGSSLRPVFVNSDIATLPIAIIDRGEQRVLDFYFALPADPPELSAFAFAWQLKTPERRLASSTRFARQPAGVPPRTAIVLLAGWGSHWWCDPAYPWPLYYHHDGPIAPRPPVDVAITRPPR